METGAIIGTFVSKLSNYLSKNNSFIKFLDDFTDATIDWIRPLFLKDDGEVNKVMNDLETRPDDTLNQDDVKTTIAKFLRDNPTKIEDIIKIIEKINETSDEKDVKIVKQTHFGSGDNVAGNKIVNEKK